MTDRTPAAGPALIQRHWVDQGFRDDTQSSAARDRAAAWVSAYLQREDPEREPIGLERTVATKTQVLAIRGKVDRIDERVDADGRRSLAIVDYKTSRRTSTEEEARTSLQLAMYAAAVERTLRQPCTVVELHHVPTGTVARWEYRPGQRERHLNRADDLGLEAFEAEQAWKDAGGAESIAAADADSLFPPSPSPRCSWCDFRTSCPEGAAVSSAVEPWAALERPTQD